MLAVGSELAAPPLRLVGRALSRTGPTHPSEWRRALIVGHGHIGDVLYQTVSLRSLADGLPQCELDYLTTPLGAEVLAGNPALKRILPWNCSSDTVAVSKGTLAKLNSERYDAIICTSIVRHQDGLMLGLRLHIPNRVAFTHRGLSGLATVPVRLAAPATPAHQSRIMAHAITGISDGSELRPCVFVTDDEVSRADQELTRLAILPSEAVLACAITTRQTLGQPGPEIFRRILSAAHRHDPSLQIVLCGTAEDESLLRNVAAEIPGHIAVSAGRLPVRAFAAFLGRCNAFFGMDSGPRHLANAMQVPCTFIRNMGVREAEAGAYCPSELDIAPSGSFLDARQIATRVASICVDDAAAAIVGAARANKLLRRSDEVIEGLVRSSSQAGKRR